MALAAVSNLAPILVAASGTNVTLALTGSAVTVSAGTLTDNITQALAGSASTVSAGSLTPAVVQALAGIAATVSAGTLTADGAESVQTGAPDYGDTPKRKRKGRYVAEVGGKLVVFTSAAEALAASQGDDEPQAVEAARSPRRPSPLFSVSLDDVRALASEREALAVFQRQLERMQYDALLRSYEKWQREQDEQDIEELLLLI